MLCPAGSLSFTRAVFYQNAVSWTHMVVVCCKAGAVVSARELFDRMPDKNLVLLTTTANERGVCARKYREAHKMVQSMSSVASSRSATGIACSLEDSCQY
ncbi:hypothetical protein GW17_00028715 [Ensete ventricosum]|nr:hypothetical protein GW17_00028715 [Ensete ventricosum]